MFPEIVRDEVFRIESRRLWLRWPVAADAFDTATPASSDHTRNAVEPLALPALVGVAAWRREMEQGTALHLVLEDKHTRCAIGIMHLTCKSDGSAALAFTLAAGSRGKGLMTEAVQAALETLFLLRAAPRVAAVSKVEDLKTRDVLERAGFAYAGCSLDTNARGTHCARDTWFIDRTSWVRRQPWAGSAAGRPSQLDVTIAGHAVEACCG